MHLALLALQQAHWRIENRLHYRRDVTLGEDACQVRMSGASPSIGSSQWWRSCLNGLAAGAVTLHLPCVILRSSIGSFAFAVWRVIAVERVNQKALYGAPQGLVRHGISR